MPALSIWFGMNDHPALLVWLFLLLSGYCLVRYFPEKCLVLFTTNGANGIFFLFKRSVTEGTNVDESLAYRIAGIVKQNHIAQAKR